MNFGYSTIFSSYFTRQCEILERISELSYPLPLPPQLLGVHSILYVSILRNMNPNYLSLDHDTPEEECPYHRDEVACFVGQDNRISQKNHDLEESTYEDELEARSQDPHLVIH